MLKWTLRNPSDAPTPPPPPEARYQVQNAEVKFNLKDSNKCWLATQVKVAQVRSTSKIVETSIENGENAGEESGKFDQGKENDSIFKRWMSASHPHVEEDKKRKRHHKHTKCNPLDPLRLFSGEVTDSDTGSVYMRLDHTPAALQPRPQVVATTGPNDPRRKPLIDISNGDYSDLRKHLQHISTSHLHHHPHNHHHHYHHHHQLPQYLQKFAPCYTHHHQHIHHEGKFQVVDGARHPHRTRPDPLGASASQVALNPDHRRRSRSSSRSRSRSSSVSRPRPLMAVNSSLVANSSVTSTTPNTSRGVAEGQSHSMLQGCRAGDAPHAFKRHSIADIPTEASFRGVWEIQKERRGRSSSHERREGSQDRSKLLRFSRDKRKECRVEEERSCRSGRERVEGRRASREKSKDEPIYEKVGGANTSSTSTSDSSITSKKSKATSGSSLTSRKSRNSYDNAVYMSMRDLRAHCPQEDMRELSEYDGEHAYSSLHIRISPDPNKTPVQMRDHLYENMLYLPMTEIKSALKKPQDRCRPLPEPPNFDDPDLDDTCDFTSEPQKDIHKPVAIKISNELIARFGKSPNDRQHPMPHYGLYIAAQPSKKPCAVEDGQDAGPHRVPSEMKPTKVYKSTGQHVHIDYSEKQSEPSIPLHNLRPPPPPPPRKFRSTQGSGGPRVKIKPKGQTKPKPDSHLPVIYENTRQGEDLTQSAKKRKLRHTMEIEFSFEDDDIPINRSSEDASAAGTSPRGGAISSSDNPDSGVSEGITTPLISPLSAPRSPQTPRSDSLLEEPCTPLSLEELHAIKENADQKFIRENDFRGNSTVLSNMSHDITDPRFLESPFKNGSFGRKGYARQPSFGNEGFSDDTFHQLNTLYLQQTNSSISYSNVGPLCHSQLEYIDSLSHKNNDISRMLLSAVGRNLFHDSTNKISTPHRDPGPCSSLSRRHSFAGLADISRRLSSIGFSDDTSLWGMEVSDHNESTLKKAKSLNCLSPAAVFTPTSKNVPLTESMAEILRDPESRSDSRGCSRLTDSSEQTSPDASEQSVQWWVVREEDRGGRTTKGSGRLGGLAGQPSPLSDSPASQHHHLPLQPGLAKHTPTLLLLRSPTSNPTPMLPVEMSGGQHLAAGHAGASCHSVPLGPSSCEDSARPDVSQCVSNCGVDSTLPSGEGDSLTARQKRRQEESSYRLQRMLQDCTTPSLENEADDSVSADWSMEAILDEVSTLDHQDLLDTISDPLDSPGSPDSQDIISVCTLDGEYGDNIYLSPKLCEKIKQVSEDRMLARLRKSFRSKREKRSANPNTTTAPPKVGILMFVDNPMYLSPEVKKEAKIVSAQTKSENSVWYVGTQCITLQRQIN
ncbi:uncharacterized protein [Panulirus ornatus]|uniref:uncharacterized protein n=1 Tax=Panulirus ornatus TaxID=150431 RepID=UPI003A88A569